MSTETEELDRIAELVEQASSRNGNQFRLAKQIGYSVQELSQWKAGVRPCPVKAQALLAHAAGLDPAQVALYALIAGERNPQRQEKLATALGKVLSRMGAAASCVIFGSVLWASSPQPAMASTSYDV